LNESGGLLKIDIPSGGSTKLPAMPIEMNDRRFDVHQQVPAVGEHSKEILEEIGLNEETIDSLFKKSIVS
jgi:crotonobetainyl-CoA:carnitine CoA-transferase CaiB-like acyl-CoA transferase